MSISYSALKSYGKATLPSSDGWLDQMQILKDPPRSIHTRRIEKVGDLMDVVEAIDEAGDRVDCIKVYARGMNPSVSVSYSSHAPGANPSRLPYALTDSFRPPIRSPYDLEPQSRLPRIWTSASTNPGFADYTKQMSSCSNMGTQVKYDIKPTGNYGTSCTTNPSVSSDQRTFTQIADLPHKYTMYSPLQVEAYTNPSMSIGTVRMEEIGGQDAINENYTYTSAMTNPTQTNHASYIEHEYMRPQEQNRPMTEAYTITNGIGDVTHANSRSFDRLLQKVHPMESFEPSYYVPQYDLHASRVEAYNGNNSYESHKTQLGKRASNEYFQRFNDEDKRQGSQFSNIPLSTY
jgi:hypothetical protein